MLRDHERTTLGAIEGKLMADDPGITQPFRTHRTRLQRHRRRRGAGIAAVVAALLVALMLLAGSTIGALASAVPTGLVRPIRPRARHRS